MFATALFFAAALAGSDNFDDLTPTSPVDGVVTRPYGSVFAESYWSPTGWLEIYDEPWGSGKALASYGDSIGAEFTVPVDSFRIDLNACVGGCGCDGGYWDPAAGAWISGQDAVILEVRDSSGAEIESLIIDWEIDPLAISESRYDEEGYIDIDYSRPVADIGSFAVHWGSPCYLLADDLEYGSAGGGGLTPEVEVTGTCAGTVDFDFSGFTPGGEIELAASSTTGSYTIGPRHPCAGLDTGLGADTRVRTTVTADANGDADFSRLFRNNRSCGYQIRAIDLTTCTMTSAVVGLP